MKHFKILSCSPLIFATLLFSACASQEPASNLIENAQAAMNDNENARNCAAETYALAQKALREAQEAQDKRDTETARQKARLAQSLAKQAKEEAALNLENCNRKIEISAAIQEKLFDDELAPTEPQTADSSYQTIYFDFDESALSATAISALSQNVSLMKSKPGQNITLAAHTDERGTTEYNLALSQKRGDAVKEHAVTMGIAPSRLFVVPYGKEKPAAIGSREQDYALNRRVEFIPR